MPKPWAWVLSGGAALALTGGFVFLYRKIKRIPPGQLQPPPRRTKELDVIGPAASAQPTFTSQPTVTVQTGPPVAQAGATNIVGEEVNGFQVTVAPQPPTVQVYSNMEGIVGFVVADGRKKVHPTPMDTWVKGHIEGLPEASHIRDVLEGRA